MSHKSAPWENEASWFKSPGPTYSTSNRETTCLLLVLVYNALLTFILSLSFSIINEIQAYCFKTSKVYGKVGNKGIPPLLLLPSSSVWRTFFQGFFYVFETHTYALWKIPTCHHPIFMLVLGAFLPLTILQISFLVSQHI